jgi:hypothetical protein
MHQWNDGLLDLQQTSDNNLSGDELSGPHDTEFLASYGLAASAGCAADLQITVDTLWIFTQPLLVRTVDPN